MCGVDTKSILKMPRVLLVNSQNIYKANATGITMRSLWGDLDPNKILELYQYQSKNTVKDDTIKFKSFQIPPQTKRLHFEIRQLLKLDNFYDTYDSKISDASHDREIRISKKQSLKSVLITSVKALLENEMIRNYHGFFSVIDEFKPEVIYSMGSSFFVHSWVLFLSKRYDIPVVMHYMDDWRETVYKSDSRTKWLNFIMAKQLNKIEKRMKCGLTISEMMAEAYREKYGNRYIPIMNSVSSGSVKRVKHPVYQIVYAGGLHLDRYKSLLEIAKEISKLENIKLIIYTSERNILLYKDLFIECNVEFRNAVPHDKVFKVYEEADLLLHIESFNPDNVKYTRYSLSTKIPEYMSSGKPIVCYAPSEIAVYQYIKSNKIGICIDKASDICQAIEQFQDEAICEDYIGQATRIASEKHSRQYSQKELLRVLNM